MDRPGEPLARAARRCPRDNGGQASFGGAGQGGANTNLTGLQIDQALLSYLEGNTQRTKYLMAAPILMQGADYVIATGRPMLYLRGFNGQDQVETTDSLAQLVADGELKYVYLGGGGGPGAAGQSSITAWVTSHGTAVTGLDDDTKLGHPTAQPLTVPQMTPDPCAPLAEECKTHSTS